MNETRLLDAIGKVDDRYIEEMTETYAFHHRQPMKRLWLVAAIVAAMLVLLGCAVFSLIKMRVEEAHETTPNGETVTTPEGETVMEATIHFEQTDDVYIEIGAYYPKQIPDGYSVTFITEGAPLSQQRIDYENGEGNTISYWIMIGDPASNVELTQIIAQVDVEIKGCPGVLYEQEYGLQTLLWIDEYQGYGFVLETDDVDVDLIAMAESTDVGETLTPSRSEMTVKALEELGDYGPQYLPEGYEERGVMGSPLEEGGGWYSYVRRYYANQAENATVYFEYETYVIATADGYEDNARTVCSFFIPGCDVRNGEVLGEEIEINGMYGLMTEEHIAWADPEKHVVYHLYSEDVTGEELLRIAQSIVLVS